MTYPSFEQICETKLVLKAMQEHNDVHTSVIVTVITVVIPAVVAWGSWKWLRKRNVIFASLPRKVTSTYERQLIHAQQIRWWYRCGRSRIRGRYRSNPSTCILHSMNSFAGRNRNVGTLQRQHRDLQPQWLHITSKMNASLRWKYTTLKETSP